jgi:integrase
MSVSKANERLKSGKVGVAIAQRGDRLSLVATLPPKPNSKRSDWHQQRISLEVYANQQGIQFAEAEAHKISRLIANKIFDWQSYLKIQSGLEVPLKLLIQRFKDDFFSKGRSVETWLSDYWKVFKRLPLEEPLQSDRIMELIRATAPNTKTRKRYCIALSKLAKFAEIPIDLSEYMGNYSTSSVGDRHIPTDDLIVQTYAIVPNQNYQFLYGLLATYGLRPHELFLLDFSSMPILQIKDGGKSGNRRVWAFLPEWINLFDLNNPKFPKTTRPKTVSTQFYKYDLPFHPYALRHAWAIRTMSMGLPLELAAKQMGHSMTIHSKVYHRWISDRQHEKAYKEIFNL